MSKHISKPHPTPEAARVKPWDKPRDKFCLECCSLPHRLESQCPKCNLLPGPDGAPLRYGAPLPPDPWEGYRRTGVRGPNQHLVLDVIGRDWATCSELARRLPLFTEQVRSALRGLVRCGHVEKDGQRYRRAQQ